MKNCIVFKDIVMMLQVSPSTAFSTDFIALKFDIISMKKCIVIKDVVMMLESLPVYCFFY